MRTSTDVRVDEKTSVARLLSRGVLVALSSFLLASYALFGLVMRKEQPAYQPLPPLGGFLSSQPRVDTATRREQLPYTLTDLLVVFQDKVTDTSAVIQDILRTAPPESPGIAAYRIEASQKNTDPVTSQKNKQNEQQQAPTENTQEGGWPPKAHVPIVKDITAVFPNFATAQQFLDEASKGVAKIDGETMPSLPNVQRITFTQPADVTSLRDHFQKDDRIKSVSLNRLYETTGDLELKKTPPRRTQVPSDPFLDTSGSWGQPYADLWGLKAETMDAVGAWPIKDGDPSIIIAVSDTGIDYTHEDIAANIWANPGEIPGNGIDDDHNGFVDDTRGYDFTTCQRYVDWQGCVDPKPRDADPMDGNGHGTHVAGTIAAVRNNNVGIAGVCPRCKVMAVKGMNDQGSGESDDLAQSIYYAARNGAKIINMSWGGYGTDAVIQTALEYAHAAGVWLVVAAGNDDADTSYFFPASYQWAITVAATDSFDRKASFSNWGDEVDVAAPGVDILSLRAQGTNIYGDGRNFVPPGDPNAKYMRLSGTSMASPHIAGALGLILAKGLTDPLYQLYGGAEDVNNNSWDVYFGNGRSNAKKSLSLNATALKIRLRRPNQSTTYFERGAHIAIIGSAGGTRFASYTLDYAPGRGQNPAWQTILTSTTPAESAVGSATLGTWDTGALIGKYVLRLTVRGNDGSSISEVNVVYTGVTPGWPKTLPDQGDVWNATVADFDPAVVGDEIVYPSTGGPYGLYGIHGNGSRLSPVQNAATDGTPTFADVDKDGQLEMLVINGNLNSPGLYLQVLNPDGSSVAGFPVVLPALPMYEQPPTMGCPTGLCQAWYDDIGAISVGDLDHDGHVEIAVPLSISAGAMPSGRLLIYSDHGSLLTPADDGDENHYRTDSPYGFSEAPALGDLDGDGNLELVLMDNFGWVRAYDHTGTPVAGWPQWANTTPASPVVLADLDGDTRQEVIAVSPFSWNIHIWYGDGRRYGHSPYGTLGSPSLLAVADLDRDGVQEIIVHSNSYLSVLRRNGVQAESFPVKPFLGSGSWNWPLIVQDIDPSSAGAEVVWKDVFGNLLMATGANGQHLPNPFPFIVPDWPTSPPLVGDFTGDGLTDVVVIHGQKNSGDPEKAYLFELGTPISTSGSAWPTVYHDLAQTKRADCPDCHANTTRPYDARVISCDQKPETPMCDRGGYANAVCGTNVCQADCTCTQYVEQQRGWPQLGLFFNHDSVVSADLDADGSPEVIAPAIVAMNGSFTVYRADGTSMPGFPVTGDYAAWGSQLAIGNIDANPQLEIASTYQRQSADYVWHYGYAVHNAAGQRLWTAEDLRPVPGNYSFAALQTPIIADVLPNHPGAEVIGVVSFETIESGYGHDGSAIYVWDGAGSLAPGFPVLLDRASNATAAVGDVDGDGVNEIVVTTTNSWVGQSDTWDGGGVTVIDHVGSVRWHKSSVQLDSLLPQVEMTFSAPTLGDVDVDSPGKEIVLSESTYPSTAGKVHVLKGDGSEVVGWPTAFGSASQGSTLPPIVAELDGDGRLEVAAEDHSVTDGPRLFVFEHNGAVKPGWPVKGNYYGEGFDLYMEPDECRLTATDLDGDGKAELVLCGKDGHTWAFNDDTSQVANWPMLNYGSGSGTTPTFADLDNDGDVEFLHNSTQGLLYAYDLPVPTRFSSGDWRSDRYDPGRSGASSFMPRDTVPPTTPGNLHVVSDPTTIGRAEPAPTKSGGGVVAGVHISRIEIGPPDDGGGGGVKPKFLPLAWDASTDATSGVAGYKVYFCYESAAGCIPNIAIDVGNVTFYTATTAVLGKSYSYEVTAYDRAGNESVRSSRLTVPIFQ